MSVIPKPTFEGQWYHLPMSMIYNPTSQGLWYPKLLAKVSDSQFYLPRSMTPNSTSQGQWYHILPPKVNDTQSFLPRSVICNPTSQGQSHSNLHLIVRDTPTSECQWYSNLLPSPISVLCAIQFITLTWITTILWTIELNCIGYQHMWTWI